MFLWPNVVLFTPILCNLCKEKKMVEIEKVESRKSDTIKVMKFYHVSELLVLSYLNHLLIWIFLHKTHTVPHFLTVFITKFILQVFETILLACCISCHVFRQNYFLELVRRDSGKSSDKNSLKLHY